MNLVIVKGGKKQTYSDSYVASDGLPSEVIPDWTKTSNDAQTEQIVGNTLYIKTDPVEHAGTIWRKASMVTQSLGATLVMKAKGVVQGDTQEASIYMGMSNGARTVYLLSKGNSQIIMYYSGGSTIVACDITKNHVYRLIVDTNDKFSLYIDDVLKVDSKTGYSTTDASMTFGIANKRESLGAEIWIEYTSWDTTGAYPPSQRPANHYETVSKGNNYIGRTPVISGN